ncbi:MAG: TRAM domain-containing protein [Promicromonosporaceae bacterium]|nr:TRAM domain-containing protein [Promicromonosporaceae bacterium]
MGKSETANVESSEVPEGDFVELNISAVAHGGHCVARIGDGPDAGRVVFVRHALPGERVLAQITSRGKIWRADALAVIGEESPFRVPTAWPEAGPGGVGGGELAHVSRVGQRRWKAAIIAEQLRQLGSTDVSAIAPELAVSTRNLSAIPDTLPTGRAGSDDRSLGAVRLGVEDVGGESGYRTRIDLDVNAQGRVGMKKHRSHEIQPLKSMPLATAELQALSERIGLWDRQWPPGARLKLVAPSGSEPPRLYVNGRLWHDDGGAPESSKTTPSNARRTGRNREAVSSGSADLTTEIVTANGESYRYQIPATGFWQVHQNAPAWLVETVLAAAQVSPGDKVLDLYAGSGLFAVPLAIVVGEKGQLIAVEGAKAAASAARANLGRFPYAQVLTGDVAQVLGKLLTGGKSAFDTRTATRGAVANTTNTADSPVANDSWDCVVLDPPRVGAGRGVCKQITQLEPHRIVYVACDPAALARDVGFLRNLGYRLTALKAADLFPMTHHMEAVATLTKT